MNKKVTSIVLIIAVYILSAGISYVLFGQSVAKKAIPQKETSNSQYGKVAFDDDLPKTEPCPLNGTLYSKPQREWWEKHRPLGVMIENHVDSRPQSGLSSADVVYEAVAEGGITRFLAVYYCQDAEYVGPVRSARTYFLDFISEYGDYPLYAHVGGANTPGPANAIGQIEDYGWQSYNDLNQFSVGLPTFKRLDSRLPGVATEHTVYSNTSKLWEFADAKRKLTNVDKEGNPWDGSFVQYSFKDDVAEGARPATQTITIEFWNGYKDFVVDWTYDRATNIYKRNNGGEPHMDKNNNKQLTAKNVVVLFMDESNANDGYDNNAHLLYKTKGSGKAMIFQDGKRITGTWKKADRTGRTQLFDSSGAAVKFNRGKIWFSVLPTDSDVTVQ